MTEPLRIELEWLPPSGGAPEVRQAAALLSITCGEHRATRIEDSWSQSVHQRINVSAYPLALWLASSWWRLRWEAATERTTVEWRMAHEMPAAGYGYVWPPLTFVWDGQSMEVRCRASDPDPSAPISYLTSFTAHVAGSDFEACVDRFLGLVLARLDAGGLAATELHGLWQEVLGERRDDAVAAWRRLEAQLGFDPDAGPPEAIDELVRLGGEAGVAALAEVAGACAGRDPATALRRIRELAGAPGTGGQIAAPAPLRACADDPVHAAALPWERGRTLARKAREAWGLGQDAIPDKDLAAVLHVPGPKLLNGGPGHPQAPLALAIRADDGGRLRLHFRKSRPDARRFEVARFLADFLMAPADDHWLPVTDTKTARQKAQRAFAAEFLTPIDSLQAFLADDFSDDALESAAEHFGVSALAVRSHLANNGLIPAF